MRGLDDPENPYLDEYKPWDVWTYMHEVSVLEEFGVKNIWLDRPGVKTMIMSVDTEGFPVPSHLSLRWQLEIRKNGTADEDLPSCTHSIRARGKISQKLQDEKEELQYSIMAEYYPEIPEFLVKSPPKWAMIHPDGRVVTLGLVGTNDRFKEDDELSHYLYSADGMLIDSTKTGETWMSLFCDFDAIHDREMARDNMSYYEMDGILTFYDGEQYYKRYNYDGTRIPNAEYPPKRSDLNFEKIGASDLIRIYAAQQAMKGSDT